MEEAVLFIPRIGAMMVGQSLSMAKLSFVQSSVLLPRIASAGPVWSTGAILTPERPKANELETGSSKS